MKWERPHSAAKLVFANLNSHVLCIKNPPAVNDNNGLPLVTPRVVPVLDESFRPAVLANRAFREQVRKSGSALPIRIALEQADGSVYHFHTDIFSDDRSQAAGNYTYVERIVKFLLWSRGGWRIYFDGPATLAARLAAHYREDATGKFDSDMVGAKMFDHALEVVNTPDLPPERAQAKPLGRQDRKSVV